MFQSTRPCGARLYLSLGYVKHKKFQSTRPCGARHIEMPAVDFTDNVSIHAPLRGATTMFATSSSLKPSFNPRAPAGRD